MLSVAEHILASSISWIETSVLTRVDVAAVTICVSHVSVVASLAVSSMAAAGHRLWAVLLWPLLLLPDLGSFLFALLALGGALVLPDLLCLVRCCCCFDDFNFWQGEFVVIAWSVQSQCFGSSLDALTEAVHLRVCELSVG